MKLKPNILIIMELKQREFVPKMLLSKIFAEAGWRVSIGTINSIPRYAKELEPSVILHKGLLPNSKEFKSIGHRLAVLDEEGGFTTPWSSIEDFCKARYPQLAIETPDVFLAPNEEFAKHVNNLRGASGMQIEVTGWPRIDTWLSYPNNSLRSEADEIKKQYGPFFVYLSSFGWASEKKLQKLAKQSKGIRRKRMEHRANAFRGQLRFLEDLANAIPPDQKVIVRPHTIESVKDWRKSLGRDTRVQVQKQGDVMPWIMASEGVIVWGSTTAVQAALMGKTTLQYQVEEILGQTDTLSYRVPFTVESPEQAAEFLDRKDVLPKEKVLSEMEAEGWLDTNETASEKVLRAIEKIRLDPLPFQNSSLKLRAFLTSNNLLSFLKHAFQMLGIFRGTPIKSNDRSVFGNMPGGLSEKEIRKTLEGFENESKNCFEIVRIGTHLFSIEANRKN